MRPNPSFLPIVNIGEMHKQPAHEKIERECLGPLAERGYRILLLEENRAWNPVVGDFLLSEGIEERWSFYCSFLRLNPQLGRVVFRDEMETWTEEELSQEIKRAQKIKEDVMAWAARDPIVKLIETAKEKGYRVFCIDGVEGEDFKDYEHSVSPEGISLRDRIMAKNIAEVARRFPGEGILVINGAYHVGRAVFAPSSLTNELKKEGHHNLLSVYCGAKGLIVPESTLSEIKQNTKSAEDKALVDSHVKPILKCIWSFKRRLSTRFLKSISSIDGIVDSADELVRLVDKKIERNKMLQKLAHAAPELKQAQPLSEQKKVDRGLAA